MSDLKTLLLEMKLDPSYEARVAAEEQIRNLFEDKEKELAEALEDIEHLNSRLNDSRTPYQGSVDEYNMLKAQVRVLKDAQLRTYDGLAQKADMYEDEKALADQLAEKSDKFRDCMLTGKPLGSILQELDQALASWRERRGNG